MTGAGSSGRCARPPFAAERIEERDPLAPGVAADYFVCDCASGSATGCAPGADGAAGTAGDPWQSYDKARQTFGSMSAGDAVLFCRGGAWDVSGASRWSNGACRADTRCRVGAYDPPWGGGSEPRPILRRVDGQNGFALEDGGNADHEEGYLFEDLDLRGSGGLGAGIFAYNDIDDVTLRNLSIDGFGIGVHSAGSNPCSADPQCDGLNAKA